MAQNILSASSEQLGASTENLKAFGLTCDAFAAAHNDRLGNRQQQQGVHHLLIVSQLLLLVLNPELYTSAAILGIVNLVSLDAF